MNCYCYETDTDFVLCVEDAEEELKENIIAGWFKESDNIYIKPYPLIDIKNGGDIRDIELVKRNFARLGMFMFHNMDDWQSDIKHIAQILSDNGLEWYIAGSISEAILGVEIEPHDIDIIVHTDDFFKVKEIFIDSVVEPFIDNKGHWVVRYFGRICLNKGFVDIIADEAWNKDKKQYDMVSWFGYNLFIEPLQTRYKIEISRNRIDRIKAFEEYMNR